MTKNRIPLFDLHCDTVTTCSEQGCEMYSNSRHISLEKGMLYRKWCQVFAIWIPDELRGIAAQKYFERNVAFFLDQMEKYSDAVRFCKTARELRDAATLQKCGALLAIEGGAALGGEITKLEEYYQKGVRILTLTWNGKNELACGCMDGEEGLTEFGRQVLIKMGKLGMIADVSHLNEKGFYELAELQAGPFIASHSNFSDVWHHKRNLSREQFDILRQTGGLVGLNLYWNFLGDNEDRGMDNVYRHLSYGLVNGGEKILALGCDFDGADLPKDLNGIEYLEPLFEYLLSRGIQEDTLMDVFYGNAFRFFQRVL